MYLGHILTNNDLFTIPESWLILDTCSTCNVAKNPNFVIHIKECKTDERLTAYCNGGKQKYNLIAKLILFPIDVHFKHDSMANIVSMKTVTGIGGVRVTMDKARDENIVVTLADGRIFEFKLYSNRLYYFNTKSVTNNVKSKETVTNYSLIQTVQDNKSHFTV